MASGGNPDLRNRIEAILNNPTIPSYSNFSFYNMWFESADLTLYLMIHQFIIILLASKYGGIGVRKAPKNVKKKN